MRRIELQPVRTVKVKEFKDLGRIAAYLCSLGQPVYVLHFKEKDRNVYGILMIFKDYYNLYGVPLFYYYIGDRELDGNYILVKVDERGERVEISKGTRVGWFHAPIIRLEKRPEFIRLEEE